MEQLTLTNLVPRHKQAFAPDVCYVPNWLTLTEQAQLLEQLRDWTKKHWVRPQMPDGTKMNHPFCCLGWQWKPYTYFEPWCELPDEITQLYTQAIAATLPWFKPMGPITTPDTAIINWFPPGSSLGMHQDKSEAESLLKAGSPIVTISLGQSAIFRLGNCWDRGKPYQDIELCSGDLLVMGGQSRLAYHSVLKIIPGTTSPELQLSKPGRLSITIRQSQERGS